MQDGPAVGEELGAYELAREAGGGDGDGFAVLADDDEVAPVGMVGKVLSRTETSKLSLTCMARKKPCELVCWVRGVTLREDDRDKSCKSAGHSDANRVEGLILVRVARGLGVACES
ncbi:hypothetical protein [Streptomyces chartreusis]